MLILSVTARCIKRTIYAHCFYFLIYLIREKGNSNNTNNINNIGAFLEHLWQFNKITHVKCSEHCLACNTGSVHATNNSSSPSLKDLQSVLLNFYPTKPLWEKPPMVNSPLNSMIIFQSVTVTLDLYVWPTPSPWPPFSWPLIEYYSQSTFNHDGSCSPFGSLKVLCCPPGLGRALPGICSFPRTPVSSGLRPLQTLLGMNPQFLSPAGILLILDHYRVILCYRLQCTKPKTTFTVYLLNFPSWP